MGMLYSISSSISKAMAIAQGTERANALRTIVQRLCGSAQPEQSFLSSEALTLVSQPNQKLTRIYHTMNESSPDSTLGELV